MRITMVGSGYVGLVTGTCLSNTGNDVICLDIDQAKIDQLNSGQVPIYEPGLDELIRRNVKAGRLHFSTDKQLAYEQAEIVFICVPTPSDHLGQADLQYVLAAARDIGTSLNAGSVLRATARRTVGAANETIVVIKSTVPVGTNAKVKAVIADHTDKPFSMASNPEFLKEGAAINDFNRPDRVVIGVEDKRTGDRMRDLYEPFVRQGNPIFVMDIASAEMVKYASNAMLATKISFINEIANLSESCGANIDEVRRGMCSDRRIGNQFLYPGLGYGGSCFPKDVLACLAMGEEAGVPTSLLREVHAVNQRQREAFIKKIESYFAGSAGGAAVQSDRPMQAVGANGLEGRRLAMWGIAFKPGTDDIREAPSITLMRHLIKRGATIVAHDPVAHDTCRQVMGSGIEFSENMMGALAGTDALIICTDWDEYRYPDFEEMKQRMKHPVIFDGRNLYRLEVMREYGFTYYSVGRRASMGS